MDFYNSPAGSDQCFLLFHGGVVTQKSSDFKIKQCTETHPLHRECEVINNYVRVGENCSAAPDQIKRCVMEKKGRVVAV